MKRVRSIAAVVALALSMPSLVLAQASTPQAIKVQGYLTQSGTPVNGTVTMGFALYDADFPGGTNLGALLPQSVTVANGIYEVELAFQASLFTGSSRYLEITVNGETLTPRIHLASTPFAYQAEKLDGFEGADFVKKAGDTMSGPLTVQGTVTSMSGGFQFPDSTVQTTAATRSNMGNTLDQAYDQGGPGVGRTINADSGAVAINGAGGLSVAGNVGIGTQVPATTLDVAQNGASTGMRLSNAGTGGTVATLYNGSTGAINGMLSLYSGTSEIIRLYAYGSGNSWISAGNVGIGTTAPGRLLDINGITRHRDLALFGASDEYGTVTWSTSGFNILGNSGRALTLGANGTPDRVTVATNGNVGIGTTSPTTKLTVAGVIQSTTGGIKFPDGTTQTTATLPHTFAACVNFSGTNCTTIFCSCGSATQITQVQSDCTVTSDTGSCSAYSFSCAGGGIGHGTCCVCRP
ncbi:MAG: hypothetical protein LAO51_14335 [Acidobacteriia bacterium]|nr:hypothetical protein [Terriglobia bacterium]